MVDTIELRKDRAKLVADARVILDRNDKELSSEDKQQYDKIIADVEALGKRIEIEERQQKLELELGKSIVNPIKPEFRENDKDEPVRFQDPKTILRCTPEYRDAFHKVLAYGRSVLNADETRALSAGSDVSGGFTVVPPAFVEGIIKAVDNAVLIRQLATKHRVERSQSLGLLSLDNDPADPVWTSEITTGDEDSTMSFGKREMHTHRLAKRAKISNALIAASIYNIEDLVRDRLTYKFAITMEAVYMTGHGAGQPLGLFTASNDGISTTYDVSTGNTSTSITFDGLMNAKMDMKEQYQKVARWIFHREAILQIMKLKQGEGVYYWQPSVTLNTPDMLLGRPASMSEYAPHAFTASQYVGILGDFSFYHVADALDMQIQRLVELYAETDQTGFIGRFESDAMPVLGEAFRRVTLTA